MMATAHLTYDAISGQLTGTIGGGHFMIHAASGGGRGSTNPNVPQKTLQSHLATTKAANGTRGGTLPPGDYVCHYVAHHPKFHQCIALANAQARVIKTSFASAPIVHHRGGFFIHGRGEHGSDGCIVPYIPAQRLELNNAVKHFSGQVVLTVKGVGYMLPAENFTGTPA